MKKVLLGTAATAMAVMLAGSAFAGPASTFSANVNGGIDLSIVSLPAAGAESITATVLDTSLKVPGSKKDLLIGVSIESGVFTETQVKGKNGENIISSASGTIDIRVLIDDVEVAPGVVTFNHRFQELEATLGGVIQSCEDGSNGGALDGVIDVDVECVVTDELIRLLLDTTTANHFNFVAPNVGPGDHTIEVEAILSADEALSGGDGVDNGSSEGQAVINIGSLTVEVVRSANTTDGIVVE